MTRRHVHAALLALLLAITSSPTPLGGATWNPCADGGSERPDEGGIGGTGAKPSGDEGGIGGTGARPGTDEGGIGGTGFTGSGAIGVIGTVTGFGSICVGPTEVHYTAATPVSIDERAVDVGALGTNQVVEIVADTVNGELHARAVVVRHVVQGPITAYDRDAGRFEVMGQAIAVGATPGLLEMADQWPVGTVVRVNGFRRGDGAIVPSRLDRLDPTDAVTLTGPWSNGMIGATAIDATPSAPIANGSEVRVHGRWVGDKIHATSIEPLPAVPFGGAVARVALEGFPRRSADGTLRVDRFPVTGAAADGIAAAGDARVRVEAYVHGRTLMVERATRIEAPRFRPSRHETGPPHGAYREPPDMRPDGGPGGDGMPPPRPDGGPPPRDGAERMERPDRPDRPDQMPRPDRPERPAPPDRPDRPPRPERPNQAPPRPDRPPLPPERVVR